jgi:hypothetical protein
MLRQVIGDSQQGLGGIALSFGDLQGFRDEWEGGMKGLTMIFELFFKFCIVTP